MSTQNGTEIRDHIIYWENMKEIDNSRDLGTDGMILNALLKLGCERGENDATG
jgi:hypothetical protein